MQGAARRRPYSAVWPALALLALAVLVYAPLLSPGEVVFSPHSDVLPSHLATRGVLYDALGGGLPLWRRDLMLGAPALNDPQALYGHPLALPFAWLPPLFALGPTLVLELWIAALGMYALARVLGCSRSTALLAGVAQLVCFKWIAAVYAGWFSVLATLCLLPALAAVLFEIGRAPSRLAVLSAALVFACILASGTPQTAYYLVLCMVPYLVLAARTPANRTASLRASLAGLGASAGFGLLANAYLWVPLIVELPWLARGTQDYSFFLSGHGLALSHLTTWLHPELLGSPLHHSYAGGELWEDVAYFGLLPLGGVVFAFTQLHRSDVRLEMRYLGGAFVVATLLSLDTPLLRVVYEIVPGYGVFRLPARMLFVAAVFGIALAAVGFEHACTRLSARAASWLALMLLVLMVAEGAHYARRYLHVVDQATLRVPAIHPARRIGSSPLQRVAVVGRSAFNYGWAQELGLHLVNGYNPYAFAHYKRFMDLAEWNAARDVPLRNWFDLREVARPDLLREAHVTHVLSHKPLAWPGLRLREVRQAVPSFVFYKGFRLRPVYSYVLDGARPFARFATHVVSVRSLDEMAERMRRERLEGQAYVLGSAALPQAPRDPRATADVIDARREAFAIRTRSATPGLLVIAEAFHPGWRATIDGRPGPVVQANLAFQGVVVPAGEHRVQLRFAPLGWSWTWPLSLAAWAAICLAFLLAAWRRPGASGPEQAA